MITKKIFEEITFLGGILFYLLLSFLFLILGYFNLFQQSILGLALIYILTFIIRVFYFKPRPEKIPYKNLLEKLDASSFPSVHAARVTFLSFFLIIAFIPSKLFTLLILLSCLLTLFSRLYLKKHDTIDVIGGILLGLISLFLSYNI